VLGLRLRLRSNLGLGLRSGLPVAVVSDLQGLEHSGHLEMHVQHTHIHTYTK
jgi:hypothetical protein